MGKALNGKNLGKGFSQRKDGRYEARATINGVKIDLYDMSLSKLKKAFELKKAEVLRDEKGVRPNVTLKDWYEEWFEKFKVPQLKSTSSIKSYNRKTKNTFIAILGEKRVKDITQINLQVATNELAEKGYGERTIREAIGVLRECLDIAVINRIIPVNPCVGLLVKSTYTQHKRRVMTHEEQDLFLNEAKSSYYYEAYAILLLTGIRIGDDDDKIRLNQRKPSKYKGLSRFGPEKNLQRINKFMKERPTFYKKLIQMKENFRFYLRCFYCITKVVILQFNSEKQDRISS